MGMSAERRKPRLIVMGPVPPPIHGVAVSIRLALENDLLRERFAVEHIDTTDRRPLSTMQRWDVANVVLGLRNLGQLARRLRGPKGIVYLPISAYCGAFLRDSLFIHTAALAGWKVAVHIGNTWFREFYDDRGALARWWIAVHLRPCLDRGRARRAGPPRPGRRRADGPACGRPDRYSRLRAGCRWPGATAACSSSGNFLRGKGIVEAVDAALIVLQREPDAEVLFAGAWHDSSLERELRARAAAAGDRIRFLPPVGGRGEGVPSAVGCGAAVSRARERGTFPGPHGGALPGHSDRDDGAGELQHRPHGRRGCVRARGSRSRTRGRARAAAARGRDAASADGSSGQGVLRVRVHPGAGRSTTGRLAHRRDAD